MKCESMKLEVSKSKDLSKWQACHDKAKITYTVEDCHLIHNIKGPGGSKDEVLKCIQNPNTDKVAITKEMCNQIYPYAQKDEPSYPIDKADLVTLNDRYAGYDKLVKPIGPKIDREYCSNST